MPLSKKDLRDTLANVYDQYYKDLETHEAKRARLKEDRQEFLAKFHDVAQNVVMPVFEAVEEFPHSRRGEIGPKARYSEDRSMVALEFSFGPAPDRSLCFRADPKKLRVAVYNEINGVKDSELWLPLDEIIEPRVNAAVSDFLKEALLPRDGDTPRPYGEG